MKIVYKELPVEWPEIDPSFYSEESYLSDPQWTTKALAIATQQLKYVKQRDFRRGIPERERAGELRVAWKKAK